MPIEKLRFAVLKFNLVLLEQDTHISSWLTSTLRGGFGIVFKNIVCVNKTATCKDCILRSKCAYCYLFESLLPADSLIFKKTSNIPQPFILEQPEQSNSREVTFNLILIGKAIEYLPYFIYTFDTLGKIGLGKRRNKFLLESVLSGDGKQIYSGKTMILSKDFSIINVKDIAENIQGKNPTTITLDLITPARIKTTGHLITSLPFPLLVTNLLRRLSFLTYFHCDTEEKEDINEIKKLISEAQNIRIAKSNLKWYDLERYSTRQKTRLKMGGFKGRIQYEGNLQPFLLYLYLGEYLHLGKNTTFGLGKYRVVDKKKVKY